MKDLTELTDEQWNIRYPNFPKNEPYLACPCCGLLNIDLCFLDKVQQARIIANIPFIITSACRCEIHNKKIGGKEKSKHITSPKKQCTAIDISCLYDKDRYIIQNALMRANLLHLGTSKDFIHCDNSKKIASWLY